jgi:hypothetical protein
MRGRDFLGPARDLLAGPTEAHRRAAAGRAYYAAFQEARAALGRWGFVMPPRDNIHSAVRLRFLYASDPEARGIGMILEELVQIRNEADYKLNAPDRFRNKKDAEDAVDSADALIATLDAIEAAPIRRAAVAASIRP